MEGGERGKSLRVLSFACMRLSYRGIFTNESTKGLIRDGFASMFQSSSENTNSTLFL